jgi:hypothetical protein
MADELGGYFDARFLVACLGGALARPYSRLGKAIRSMDGARTGLPRIFPLPSFNDCTPAHVLTSVPFYTAAYTRAVAIEKGFSQDDIFITGIDLTDAYYQWNIQKNQADFIAFDFLRDLYLLFGLSFGPRRLHPISGDLFI